MTKEAMKLALEALQTLHDENMDYLTRNKLGGENNQCMVFAREAITALREALAKPDFWEGYVPEPAQQKPVTRVNLDMTGAMATLPKTGSESVVEYKPVISDVGADANIAGLPGTYYGIVPKGTGNITLHESKPAQQEPVAWMTKTGSVWKTKADKTDTPLYTSPPAQRTWVNLTNNELQPIADEYRILFGGWVEDFARAIEAKLRSKNEDRN